MTPELAKATGYDASSRRRANDPSAARHASMGLRSGDMTAKPADRAWRILCIEDSHEAATLIAESLQEFGYEVQLAHDGQEGLAKILEFRPDMVLCDIAMPKLSGFQVLEQLKQLAPWLEEMPFVFLTAFTDRETELQGRKLGSDDYVTKPVDFEMLDTIIRTRLGKTLVEGAAVKTFRLNRKEIDCLTWSARGKTSDEIAVIIDTPKRNVDFHLDNARRKLGALTRVQAVAAAISLKIIKI